MFVLIQNLLASLKDRWSSIGLVVRFLIAAFAILIPALAALWMVDKLFIYLLARSYVDDVADVLDLNKHLAKALALAVFAMAVYLIGKTFSRSHTSRRIGYLGIVGLLIGHSLLLWQGTKDQPFNRKGEAIKCYVLTHDGEVRYGERPGIDPMTGRACRAVTPDLADRLQEYRKGKRPQRITFDDPTFFDVRSGEPSIWYFKGKDGTIEIFDLMGFHPDTGEDLQPITREVVEAWKVQNADRRRREAEKLRRPPQRIDDSEGFAFFDARTGEPRVWYWRSSNGEYEFYDNRGFHPRTGEPLAIITPQAIAAWKQELETAEKRRKDEQFRREKEQRERAEREERDRQSALEQQRLKEADLAAAQERERQAATLCDQLAANPTDPRKPTDIVGVRYDDLKTNATAAMEVCSLAVKNFPTEQRYRYQYARAFQINEPEKALDLHKRLVRDNYPASFDNVGWLLIKIHKDIQGAIRYFKEGARLGDPDSMVSLAELIDKKYLLENDATAARFTLLSRAAELGHPGAQLAVEKERVRFQQLQQEREFQRQQQQLMLQLFGTILRNVAH